MSSTSNNLVIQNSAFNVVPDYIKRVVEANDSAKEMASGIRIGYPVIGYKGKVWSIRKSGETIDLVREDGDPRASINVVIIKTNANVSKTFYESGWVDGSTAPPDCASIDGIKPDAGVPKKQCETCAACPQNVWGSRVNNQTGARGKACQDNKRLAVMMQVGLNHPEFADAMLLRVPPASLADAAKYADAMEKIGFSFYGVVTKIAFDMKESFPRFVFTPVQPLTETEFAKVLEMRRDDDGINRILNVDFQAGETAQAEKATPFENADPAVVAAAKATQAQQQATQATQTISQQATVPDPAIAAAAKAQAERAAKAAEEKAAADKAAEKAATEKKTRMEALRKEMAALAGEETAITVPAAEAPTNGAASGGEATSPSTSPAEENGPVPARFAADLAEMLAKV